MTSLSNQIPTIAAVITVLVKHHQHALKDLTYQRARIELVETARAVQLNYLISTSSDKCGSLSNRIPSIAAVITGLIVENVTSKSGDILMNQIVRLVWPVFRLLLPLQLAREMKLNCSSARVWFNTSWKRGPNETSRLNTACRTHHNPLHRLVRLPSSLYWFLWSLLSLSCVWCACWKKKAK